MRAFMRRVVGMTDSAQRSGSGLPARATRIMLPSPAARPVWSGGSSIANRVIRKTSSTEFR